MTNSSYDQYALDKGPELINIETTWRCNMTCRMCGHANTGFVLPDEPDFPFSLLDALAPILTDAKTIWLSGCGEPLMHPRIYDIIERVKEINPTATAAFTSNATLIRGKNIDRLIESGLDMVQVSFEGGENDLGHFGASQVLSNLRDLYERKKERGVEHPRIQLATVLMKDNVGRLKEIMDEGMKAGIFSFAIQPLRVIPGNPNFGNFKEQDVYTNKAFILATLHEAIAYGRSQGAEVVCQFMDEGLTVRRQKCRFPFVFFHVSYRGDVFMCCNGRGTGENIAERDPREIWNSEPYKKLRSIVDTENYELCRSLLAKGLGFTAVVALHDLLAVTMIEAALDSGIRVPHDLAVIGYADLVEFRRFRVPITTVHQPAYEMGRAAMNLLLDRIEEGKPAVRRPRRLLLPTELIVRESCGAWLHSQPKK